MKKTEKNTKEYGVVKTDKSTTYLPSDVKSIDEETDKQPKEYGGRKDGLDPTRYGDWEKNGRCIDF